MSEARNFWRGSGNPIPIRPKGEWRQCKGVFSYMVYLTPLKEGGFSVVAARLPSVTSQGSTEKEALANIVEALKQAIAYYKEQGVDIPRTKIPVEPDFGALMCDRYAPNLPCVAVAEVAGLAFVG